MLKKKYLKLLAGFEGVFLIVSGYAGLSLFRLYVTKARNREARIGLLI